MNSYLKATISSPSLWIGLVIVSSMPFWLPEYYLGISILTLIMIGFCLAWNMVGGIAGQFSFAHTLFIASGALLSSALYLHYGLSPWLGMLISAVAAAFLGAFVAWVAFRFKLPPLSFALITLAFSEIGLLIVLGTPFLGAAGGLYMPRVGKNSFVDFQFLSSTIYFYIAMVLVALNVVTTLWMLSSKLGYYLKAIKDNESAAQAIGVNLLKYKVIAMVISAILTSLMGTFYAQYVLYVDPYRFAGPSTIIEIVLFSTIGGLGTVWGPVLGAGILVPIGEILRGQLGDAAPGLHYIIYGILIIVVIIFMPEGILGRLKRLRLTYAKK